MTQQKHCSRQKVYKMYSIKIDENDPQLIAKFCLMKDGEEMGSVDIYPSDDDNDEDASILDLFIKEEHRKKWLGKDFAKEIVKTVTSTLFDKQIRVIYTAQSPDIPRLIDFFGFKRYNDENYFYLNPFCLKTSTLSDGTL